MRPSWPVTAAKSALLVGMGAAGVQARHVSVPAHTPEAQVSLMVQASPSEHWAPTLYRYKHEPLWQVPEAAKHTDGGASQVTLAQASHAGQPAHGTWRETY